MNPRLPPGELAKLLVDGPMIEQTFPVLQARVTLASGEVVVERAVNDFVLERASGQTVHLRTYIDGVLLNRYSGDGLVIATPGGSTAYSLAAGGPVVHQAVPGMLVTPLYAHRPVQFHSLQFPILLPLSSAVRVEAEDQPKRPVRLVADGSTREGLVAIEIRDSGRPVRLLRPADYGFIDTLVSKIIGRLNSGLGDPIDGS
jgi:NAD+ kinase